MTKVCPECGRGFEPNPARPKQKYCSFKCKSRAGSIRQSKRLTAARRAKRGKFICALCGKEFEATHHLARYCSRQCRRSVEHEKTKAAKLAARANRVCPVCGATFTPKSGKGIYCSRYCKSQARGRHILQPSVPLDIRLMEQHVREYLSLPDAERYQRRGTLTPAELKMAEKMWNQMHGIYELKS